MVEIGADDLADLRIRANLRVEDRAKQVSVDFAEKKSMKELTGFT